MVLQGVPGEIIPIMGMFTGMVTVVLVAVLILKVAQGHIGQAMARRLQGKSGLLEEEMRNELLDLREHVAQLEQRLADSEERIDFAERLLAQPPESRHLEARSPHAPS